jgi:hypothetical protein
MKTGHSVLALVACLLTMAFVSTASAVERNYWRHSGGHFENTVGNTWVEKIDYRTFRFLEVERTAQYVELYDRTRDCTVRLFGDRCMVKFPGMPRFEEYCGGRWGR